MGGRISVSRFAMVTAKDSYALSSFARIARLRGDSYALSSFARMARLRGVSMPSKCTS